MRSPVGRTLTVLSLLLLGACGGVKIKPDAPLPRPLLQPLPVRAGLVLGPELRSYKHEETRYGSDWLIELGAGHVTMMESVFAASFRDLQRFASMEEATAATGLQAIFEPRIELYSFATGRDTSGGHWAVTIRYRIVVSAPDGQAADTLTLTGYGSSRAGGGNGPSLTRATLSAMRDAAAKFLVQLPRHPLALQLKEGGMVQIASGVAVAIDEIEAVPIDP